MSLDPFPASDRWLPGQGGYAGALLGLQTDRQIQCGTPEEWSEAISAHFVRLNPSAVEGVAFTGRLQQVTRGAIRLTRVSGSAQTVIRGAREMRASADGRVFLNIQLEGEGVTRVADADVRTRIGGAALVPSDLPFELRFDRPFAQLCVDMDEAWLSSRLSRSPRDLAAVPLHLGHGLGRVLHAALEGLLIGDPSGDVSIYEDMFASALDHALREGRLAEPVGRPDPRAHTLRRVLAQEARAGSITPASIAARLNCSVRTLHSICQQQGTTFGRMLLAARLDAAAGLLATRSDRGDRVGAVAYACGFVDLSHFSRTFRQRFGCAPSEWRG